MSVQCFLLAAGGRAAAIEQDQIRSSQLKNGVRPFSVTGMPPFVTP